MGKFDYSASAVVFVNHIEHLSSIYSDMESEYEHANLSVFVKNVVRDILDDLDMLYTKELGSFVRAIVETPYTTSYVKWKRDIVGLTISEVVFGE